MYTVLITTFNRNERSSPERPTRDPQEIPRARWQAPHARTAVQRQGYARRRRGDAKDPQSYVRGGTQR